MKILMLVPLVLMVLTMTACSWQVFAYPTPTPVSNEPIEPGPATAAWSRDPPPAYQFDPPILRVEAPVCVNTAGQPSGADLVSAVSEAIAIWRSVANIPIELSGPCAAAPVTGDGLFVVGWTPLPGTTVGRTHWRFSTTSRTEFDIVIDSSDPEMTESGCLLRVVLHEIGHALALGHQPDPSSVMYPTLDCDLPILPARDAQAARSLYG